MVRTSITHLIFFIAIVNASTLFVGMIVNDVGLYAQAVDQESERDAITVDTELAIVNDPKAGTTYEEETGEITLYVKNIGDATLEPEKIDVLLDGEYISTVSWNIINSDQWRPGTVLELTLDPETALDRSEHRIVIDIHKTQEFLEFTHRVAYWLDPDTGEEFTDDEYTVDLNDTENLNLTMATEPIQEDESIDYKLNNSTVATFNATGDVTDTGITNTSGQNTTALDLHEEGTIQVDLDIGWDTDEIVVRVINSS